MKPGVERVRSEHPSDESWRADALGQSRHTRWVDELRAPLQDHDPERAAEICAAVTRAALRDFAPAVILLNENERRRAQALGAYVLMLFDFATQTGLEGERLAQINRLEFDLEAALEGEPTGQPVFVALAGTLPWPRDAFDEIASAARRRVASPQPDDSVEADREARALGGAIARSLGDDSAAATQIATSLLLLADLMGLSEGVRRRRPRLPRSVLSGDRADAAPRTADFDQPIRDRCRAIVDLLTSLDAAEVSRSHRRAARYLRSAGLRLTSAVSAAGGRVLEGPPRLGALSRVFLVLRSMVGLAR